MLCLKQWGFVLGWTSGTAVMITVVRNSKIEKLSPPPTRQLKPLHRSWLDLLQSRPFSKPAHLLNKTWPGKALTGYFVLSLFLFGHHLQASPCPSCVFAHCHLLSVVFTHHTQTHRCFTFLFSPQNALSRGNVSRCTLPPVCALP